MTYIRKLRHPHQENKRSFLVSDVFPIELLPILFMMSRNHVEARRKITMGNLMRFIGDSKSIEVCRELDIKDIPKYLEEKLG